MIKTYLLEAGDGEMRMAEITQGRLKTVFAFNPETDDPGKGSTLTGVFSNGKRIRLGGVDDDTYRIADAILCRATGPGVELWETKDGKYHLVHPPFTCRSAGKVGQYQF